MPLLTPVFTAAAAAAAEAGTPAVEFCCGIAVPKKLVKGIEVPADDEGAVGAAAEAEEDEEGTGPQA